MRPRDVRCEDDLLKMRSDNFPRDTEHWAILNNEDHILLHPPRSDDGKAFFIEIPRKDFNAIVDWYMREQKPLPHKRRGKR